MSEVLFVKYNSMRKPEYQISTRILKDNKGLFVEKRAMSNLALHQIDTIKNNGKLLQDYYFDIKILPYKEIENGVRFDFIKGNGLIDAIDIVDDKINYLNTKLDIIYSINNKYKTNFKTTESFTKIFGNIDFDESEKAYSLCNIDSIFDNFVIVDNEVWCLDYEWVFDVIIPEKFLKYRTLAYVYSFSSKTLKEEMSEEQFFAAFDIGEKTLDIFKKMEDKFQEYVRGENQKYLYTEKYTKKLISADDLLKDIENKKHHIENLDKIIESKDEEIANKEKAIELKEEEKKQQEQYYEEKLYVEITRRDNDIIHRDNLIKIKDAQIEKYRRALKNPLYGAYIGAKAIGKKVRWATLSKEEKEKRLEIARVGLYKYKYKKLMAYDNKDYESWIERVESEYPAPGKLDYNPKISILVPVYNVLDEHLIPCIESVINQTYDNWELCLADDNSDWENVRETLKKYEKNSRIKVIYRDENGHISKATNSALSVATGEFVGLLDCDDLLAPNALYEVALKLNEKADLDFIYSDEDKVDEDGTNRHMPHFKPDWSPDTLMSNMYTCHFSVYRKSIVDDLGGLRTECNGSQDYDLALRVMEETTPDKIAHIDKILYHWRERKESTSGNATVKPYVFEAAKKAKLDSLNRREIEGEVEFVETMYQYNVKYKVMYEPKVSIVIPSKDNYDVLKRCIDSLYHLTKYRNFETILVDNGSNAENKKKYEELCSIYDIKYIYEEMDFNFSKMCNIGAKEATGDYILLLNDDIEIIKESRDWLEIMLGQAQLSYTGAVGAKLLYPEDRKIQHVGVINIENGPAHPFSGMSDENIYYFGRNRLTYNVLCVTAACLLVKKKKYWEVNGIDESFAVAYNDVDFCMKLTEAGYFNVVRNDVTLLHHESASRGNDLVDINKTRRLMAEEKRLYEAHPKYAHYDPFYNKNLTQVKSDFSNNIDDYKLVTTDLEEKTVNYEDSENLESNVEVINVERYIYIEGWAFLSGKEDNNDIKHKVYLSNSEKTYVVETEKVYREDVEKIYPAEKNIEFTGFRCRFDRSEIADGEYNIGIVINGFLHPSEKKLIK